MFVYFDLYLEVRVIFDHVTYVCVWSIYEEKLGSFIKKKILNGYEHIDRNMLFSLKKHSRTRGHEVKLVKDQCRLDIGKYSFSKKTISEWNKLSTDYITASSVNMFKNKVDIFQKGGLHVDEDCWTLDKPMASLSTCHLGLWLGRQISSKTKATGVVKLLRKNPIRR